MITMLLLTMSAEAGKLTEGFRGIPWGDPAVLEKPPIEGCIKPEDFAGALWACPVTIAEVPMQAHFMVGHGIFWGVALFNPALSYSDATTLKDALVAAWGPGQPSNKHLTDKVEHPWVWTDGNVGAGEGAMATWSRNQFSGKTSMLIADTALAVKVRALDEAATAEKSKGDL